MKSLTVSLIPQPGTPPQFLATLQVVDPSPAVVRLWQEEIPESLVLEDYTRDGWAQHQSSTTTIRVRNTSEKPEKWNGFFKYLRDRQKWAFGRFGSHGVWIIEPPKSSSPAGGAVTECRVATDFRKLPNCPLKPKAEAPVKKAPVPTAPRPTGSSNSTKKKGGLLGKLVGAQHRTNHSVAMAASAAVPRQPQSTQQLQSTSSSKTAAEVTASFRQKILDQMLDFDIDMDTETTQVKVILSEYTSQTSDEITMDILKYLVYEAAEEVNEEWIVHRETTGFLDEALFTVYKEGAAPPEVLEELNQGELPDEIRAQQRALQEERSRMVQKATSQHTAALEFQAHQEEEELATLNTKKRDRRTIEDYEREKKKHQRPE